MVSKFVVRKKAAAPPKPLPADPDARLHAAAADVDAVQARSVEPVTSEPPPATTVETPATRAAIVDGFVHPDEIFGIDTAPQTPVAAEEPAPVAAEEPAHVAAEEPAPVAAVEEPAPVAAVHAPFRITRMSNPMSMFGR